MKIMSVDYGDARTGIAITDALNITVQGLGTIHNQGSDRVILRRLDEILEQYEQKLKLLEQDENRTKMLLNIRSILENALTEKNASIDALQQVLNAVNQILK